METHEERSPPDQHDEKKIPDKKIGCQILIEWTGITGFVRALSLSSGLTFANRGCD